MPNSLLTLGPFSFEGLESPERIILASKQRLVVHHLASGMSVIDSLGEDCRIASFQGIFSGIAAPARIRLIEQLKLQGMPIPLTWGSKSLSVIIKEFELDYSSNQWISYKLRCQVIQATDQGAVALADELLASSVVQVGDLSVLLQNTDTGVTPFEAAALVELADLNYDVAPPGLLGTAQDLLGSISERIAISEADLQNNSISTSTQPLLGTDWLAYSVENLGLQAALVLARNRLTEICVRAISVNLS